MNVNWRRKAGQVIVVLLLALLLRMPGLGYFLTADEPLWVSRSVVFGMNLKQGRWADTYLTEHPAVTTLWTGTLGLALADLLPHKGTGSGIVSLLPSMRLPTVLLTSIFLVGYYALLQMLFDPDVAWVSALLLTTSPFHISLSRILGHDALETTFMTLSVLSMMVALRSEGRRRFGFILLSGGSAGLAFLTKSPALFLIPFTGLMVVVRFLTAWRQKRDWFEEGAQLTAVLILWAVTASLVGLLLWPALWVAPVSTIRAVIRASLGYASEPHELGGFLLGEPRADPGLAFYPLHMLFRMTPLTLIALGLGLVAWMAGYRRGAHREHADHGWRQSYLLTMFVYVVLFATALSLAGKKQERYILPVFPMLHVLAAIGLCALGRWTAAWLEQRFVSLRSGWPRVAAPLLGAGLVLIAQLGVALPNRPYYLTYYNPLLGGGQRATEVILVGWGEGLDQAARYLNDRPDASKLRVAVWYPWVFGPYFRGDTVSLTPARVDRQAVTNSDFVVTYINQVQRRLPEPWLWDYLEQQCELETVIRLQGIPYAWIYHCPAIRGSIGSPVDE